MSNDDDIQQSSDGDELSRLGVVPLAALLIVCWPLLIHHPVGSFEDYHRREVLIIVAGIFLWTTVAAIAGVPEVLF